VVKDVGFNDTVEETAADETEFTIDCCSSSTNIIPGFRGVVGKRRVSVLEVGDGNWKSLTTGGISIFKDTHTEPVVHPEVRSEIPDSHVGETIGFAEYDENANCNSKAEITKEDELGVLGLIKRTVWVEVVDTTEEPISLALPTTFKLTLVAVVASDIAKEIHWPAQELLSNGVDQGCNWSFFGQLGQFVDQSSNTLCICLTSLGNEDHVTLHISSGLVVLAVRDLP